MSRKINEKVTAIVLIFFTSFMISCGGGGAGDDPDTTPQPTAEELQIAKIAGTVSKTWTATAITFNGAPSESYSNPSAFSITFRTAKTYSTNAGSPVFQASGNWNFNTGNLNSLIFDSNQNSIASISGLNTAGTQMTLTIDYELASAGGKIEAINGRYVFTLTAN